MSADNWAICPKCEKLEKESINLKRKKADDSYGKVSKEEYEMLNFEASQTPQLHQTLRENYEIGINENGEFMIVYRCSCKTCGFSKNFRHEETMRL